MEHFEWQHIEFTDGSNPYICMTEKEFKRIKRKYNLQKIKEGFWLALGSNKKSDKKDYYRTYEMETLF